MPWLLKPRQYKYKRSISGCEHERQLLGLANQIVERLTELTNEKRIRWFGWESSPGFSRFGCIYGERHFGVDTSTPLIIVRMGCYDDMLRYEVDNTVKCKLLKAIKKSDTAMTKSPDDFVSRFMPHNCRLNILNHVLAELLTGEEIRTVEEVFVPDEVWETTSAKELAFPVKFPKLRKPRSETQSRIVRKRKISKGR